MQSFSTSESTHNEQTDSSSSQNSLSNSNKQKVLSQNQLTTATTPSTNLRNLSLSDLFNYLKFSANQVPNSFIDSYKDYMDTTVTVAKGLAILKMLGFTNYIIPDVNKTGIINNFDQVNNKGFKLYKDSSSASIVGTYGAVESTVLLDSVYNYELLRPGAISYLNSKYYNTSTIGGFREDFQTNITASIQSTYYAVQALKALGYTFSPDQITKIYAFLQSMWNSQGHYFSNTNDPDLSVFETTFQSITILYDLGQTSQQLWSEVASGFPQFVNSNQDKSGVFNGAIHSSNGVANVDDTGSALSTLYMLNKLNSVNVTSAIQFIINSQYNGTAFTKDVGGFSYNNSTQSSLSQFSGVTLSHTYYAILGLYATGYLSNNSQFSFETEYSSSNNINRLKNEILVGQNTTFTAQIYVLNYKNYSDDQNITVQIQGIYSSYNSTDYTTTGSLYNFLINYNNSLNFGLGPHALTAYYSLRNFSIIPVIQNVYHSQIIVRFPITSSINGITSSVSLQPGALVKGIINFDNKTVQAAHISYNSLGSVSVSLVYPNGTTQQFNSSYTFNLTMSLSTYDYNFTLPKNAILGDYMMNLTYSNNTALFYTEQVFTVSTSVYLLAITSSNSYNLYPDSNFGIGFKIAYQNGYINPDISNITAKFYEAKTQQNLFSANLVFDSGNNFIVNSTEKVPVGLFMGAYNVSIDLQWNSTITNSSIPMNIANSTLSLLTYQGLPIIKIYQISPLSSRSDNTTIFSGDFLNLTAIIGVKYQNSPFYQVKNSTFDLTATLFNSTSLNQVFQELSVTTLNNSIISVYGEINPNINILSNVGVTLNLKIKYASTNNYNLIYYLDSKNNTIAFNEAFILKKAHLNLENNSINFVIGSPVITKNQYTTMLVSFKIRSVDNNQFVSGLKLNASLLTNKNGKTNETVSSLPSVTSLETNSSYQLQIPVNTLDIGQYYVAIGALNTNVTFGSFSLKINPISSNGAIPIENFIGLGTVSVAVILTIVAYSVRRKK